MEALIYIANCLYLTSYLVKDMLYLRLLSVTAALFLVGYFSSLEEPLITVIAWNLVFVGLNLVHISVLARRRRHKGAGAAGASNKRARIRKQLSNILGHFDIG